MILQQNLENFTRLHFLYFYLKLLMSVGWDVKWCPVSRITGTCQELYFLIMYSLCKTFLQTFLRFVPMIFAGLWFIQLYLKRFFVFHFLNIFMSVEWDVKWCRVSRITTPLAHKRPFHWILMKSRLVRADRETSKFQNWSHLTNCRRSYITEILPI